MHFADLFEPLGIDAFLAQFWERAPLHLEGDCQRFNGLIALDDLDAVIAVARDKDEHRGVYCVRSDDHETVEYPLGLQPGRVSAAAIHHAFDEGYTLVLNHLASVHPGTSQLCANAAAELQHAVGANLYLTPPRARGFRPHLDYHDTMFLQLEGSKVWSLWPEAELPVRGQTTNSSAATEPPAMRIVLSAGDVLYLPRGWVHAGVSTDDLSMHLTLNFGSTSVADLAVEQIRLWAKSDVRLRRSIPVAPRLAVDNDAIVDDMRRLLGCLAQADTGASPLAELRIRQLSEALPAIEPHLRATMTRRSVGLTAAAQRRDGLDPVVVVTESCCRIVFSGGEVEGPPAAEPAFRFIAERPRFTVADLPGLPDEARCDLVQELVLHGFLRTTENEP